MILDAVWFRKEDRGTKTASYLEIGSRHPDDLTTCSDIDLKSHNRDGAFVHLNGDPYA